MEEIIIDGVDVAGCEYMLNNKIKGKQHCPVKAMPYAKETSCICRKSIDTPYNFCKHNPNCHYKQLKRLEQENAKLKEEIEIRDNLSEKFRKEALSWANIANGYQKDKTKLKHTLQEIKAIAEEDCEFCDDISGCMDNGCRRVRILDLITKAEEE